MVYNKQGFFSLKTAEDLREKARADLQLMTEDPMDSFRVFNFFVTARHVPEWKWGAAVANTFISSSPAMRICRHLGDGAKHFELTSKKLTQVQNLNEHDGAFDSAAFDSGAFDTSELRVELDPPEAQAAGLPQSVEVVQLAQAVMVVLDSAF